MATTGVAGCTGQPEKQNASKNEKTTAAGYRCCQGQLRVQVCTISREIHTHIITITKNVSEEKKAVTLPLLTGAVRTAVLCTAVLHEKIRHVLSSSLLTTAVVLTPLAFISHPNDERALRPRARFTDVQVVASGLCRRHDTCIAVKGGERTKMYTY